MKKQTIKVETNIKDLVKETPEQRLERIHRGGTYTRIVPSKKVYNRRKFKAQQEQ